MTTKLLSNPERAIKKYWKKKISKIRWQYKKDLKIKLKIQNKK